MTDSLQIHDFDEAAFDPFVADELAFGDHADPYPIVSALMAQGPVHAADYRSLMGLYPDVTLAHLQHFSVFGYDVAAAVLSDAATYSNSAYQLNLGLSFGRSVSTMDAPEHTRFRRIFQKAFLPTQVNAWGETAVAPAIAGLMDAFAATGRADLVQDFTQHYPFHVIYRQLNLPGGDRRTFHKLAIGQSLVFFDKAHGIEAGEKLGAYFEQLIAQRRARPGDDLVSVLATTEVEGQTLPEDVLVAFFRQLLNAGGDTTYRATSVLLTGLLTHPEQLAAVRADRALVPQAIDEALRWDGPVPMSRMTTRDVVLGGVPIPAGSVLDVITWAANRDPARFDQPERFDIFRERGHRHLAFATGPHVCIGQHLAKVEMTRALNAVLDRLPGLRLDPDHPAPVIRGAMMRVPRHLHVRFDA